MHLDSPNLRNIGPPFIWTDNFFVYLDVPKNVIYAWEPSLLLESNKKEKIEKPFIGECFVLLAVFIAISFDQFVWFT